MVLSYTAVNLLIYMPFLHEEAKISRFNLHKKLLHMIHINNFNSIF